MKIIRTKLVSCSCLFLINRGNPTAQGNSILSLAGLAVSTSKFASGLDEESQQAGDAVTAHLSQPHWLNIVANTVLVVLDVKYQPQGRILPLCQQVQHVY